MTGRGDMGWAFYRPTSQSAIERATAALAAVLPAHTPGQGSGWRVRSTGGTATMTVQWISELPDEERRATAEVAMLPSLADVLRRVGLSTTLPDDLPDHPAAVYFAEPPAAHDQPRHQAQERDGQWWVTDTHTGTPWWPAVDQALAERHSANCNRNAQIDQERGQVSASLPGLSRTTQEVPEYRALAVELAAAGYMPAHRWHASDRDNFGFTLHEDRGVITVSHLTEGPRITRPTDPHAAEAFDQALFGYWIALHAPDRAPGRIVVRNDEDVEVRGL